MCIENKYKKYKTYKYKKSNLITHYLTYKSLILS